MPPPTTTSMRSVALDWLNFFVADVQTGVGPFVAAALTAQRWNPAQVGTFLTLAGLTSLGMQTPAGAMVDATRRKRTFLALGVAATVVASLVFAYARHFAVIMAAQVLMGAAGPFIVASIIAITLGLVGKEAFDTQIGRNASFNSAGNVFSALIMGWIGWHWGARSIFFAVPLLAVPAILALTAIPATQIDHRQARASTSGAGGRGAGLKMLIQDRTLFVFAAAAFLFHLANAAMLPQLGELLAHGRVRAAAPFMSAAVTVTQTVIALSASWIGRMCSRGGSRRMLLIGFGVLPIRGILYTLTSAVPLLIAIQVLDGVANAIFGVASVAYIEKRTHGSGHFNLTMGGLGTAVGAGAALSTALAGFITQRAGFEVSFLVLALVAALAFSCCLIFVPDPTVGEHNPRQDRLFAAVVDTREAARK